MDIVEDVIEEILVDLVEVLMEVLKFGVDLALSGCVVKLVSKLSSLRKCSIISS